MIMHPEHVIPLLSVKNQEKYLQVRYVQVTFGLYGYLRCLQVLYLKQNYIY